MNQNEYHVIVKKTQVVDVNDKTHSLPPDSGTFQEFKVADYFCPEQWTKDGIFISVKEGEPMWFDLRYNSECVCVPSIQRVNPITGEPSNLEEGLKKEPKQNYLVLPRQQWIDGYAKDGKVYQFRVTKSGEALAVNEYVLPKHMQDSHSIGFAFFGLRNPKPKTEQHHHYDGFYKHYMVPQPNYWYSAELGSSTPKYASKMLRSANSVAPCNVNVGGMTHAINESLTSGACGSSFDSAIGGGSTIMDMSDACIGDSGESPAVNCFMAAASAESDVDDRDFDKASMGMGGRIAQEIYTDNNSIDYYTEKPSAVLVIYLALPELFEAIMKKGKRQDANRKDRHILSGDVAGIPVPLIK